MIDEARTGYLSWPARLGTFLSMTDAVWRSSPFYEKVSLI
jgi:hypothetical protein